MLSYRDLTFLFFILIYLCIRMVYAWRNKAVKKTRKYGDLLDDAMVLLFGFCQVILPLVYMFSSVFDWANYTSTIFTAVVGVVAMMVGIWLFWRSHADLGKSWSVTLELNDNHELITDGVYKMIRHPMYSALFLLAFGQGMLLQNWFVAWSAMAAFSMLYLIRSPKEEAMMQAYFGEEYMRYMRRTGSLLPTLILSAAIKKRAK